MDCFDDKTYYSDTEDWITVYENVVEAFTEEVRLSIEREKHMRSAWKFIVYILVMPDVIWTRINFYRRMLFSKSGWLAKVGKRKRSGT